MSSAKKVIYTGEYRHNRDAKGRLTIPSKWREGTTGDDEFLVLPNASNECLTVYPPAKAEKFLERMSDVDLSNDEQQEAVAILSSMTQAFSYDSQGRMSLDDHLLEFAGIEGKEVVLQGNFGTFSIWNKGRYEAKVGSDPKTRTMNVSQALKKLGNL